jgi:LuxR family maltose regulon positive regulatory protein
MTLRRRVLEALEAQTAPVVCVQAPGGYGKTTLLAQWLAADSRPGIWLTVPRAAADPPWFARTLIDAMCETGLVEEHPELSGSVDAATWHLDTLPTLERLIAGAEEPFLLVIDDAGSLSGGAWEHLVASVADSLPAGSQLALATRDEVPGSLWRVHGRGDLTVIGPAMLAFDRTETIRVMGSLGVELDPDHLVRVMEMTAGWPVAVYLVGMAARENPGANPPLSVAGVSGLTEYLRHEITGPLSQADSEFLHHISVLTWLDAQACDCVSGQHDSLARLRRLADVNHLLAPQDTERTRFRMHPLLADFLSEELRAGDPYDWGSRHRAASAVDEAHGDLDGAVHHAKLAGDDRRLAELVWSHAPMRLACGDWATLKRWIDGVDESRLARHCGLALSAAWVASHLGDMARMSKLALIARDAASLDEPSCLPDVQLLEATIGSAGLESIEETARKFMAVKPVEDPWQTLSHYLLGIALLLRDEPEESLSSLREGYRLSVALDLPVTAAHCLSGMADVGFATGDRRRALTHVREARALAARARMETITTAAPLFTTSAMGYVVEGRFAEARQEANRALRLTALMRHVAPWHAVGGRLTLAQVYLALGDSRRAKVLVDESNELHGPGSASPRLDRLHTELVTSLDQASSALMGASALTTAEVRVLQYLPTHLSFPEIAEELFVSRHTVKTQALSAYRKLGAHSRSEAISQARKAGLLPPE